MKDNYACLDELGVKDNAVLILSIVQADASARRYRPKKAKEELKIKLIYTIRNDNHPEDEAEVEKPKEFMMEIVDNTKIK